jgi:hypothetical protein
MGFQMQSQVDNAKVVAIQLASTLAKVTFDNVPYSGLSLLNFSIPFSVTNLSKTSPINQDTQSPRTLNPTIQTNFEQTTGSQPAIMHPYCTTNVLFLIATLTTLVLSASLPLDAAHSAVAFEKYQMQPATFKGEIGDNSYELNGTAEVRACGIARRTPKRTRDYPSPKPTLHCFFSYKPLFFFFNYYIIMEDSNSDSEISNILSPVRS